MEEKIAYKAYRQALQTAAGLCLEKAKRAEEHEMYPSYCLNAVASTAKELADAILELGIYKNSQIIKD